MDRRESLTAAGAIMGCTVLAAEGTSSSGGEILYNNIRLPPPWPPKIAEFPPRTAIKVAAAFASFAGDDLAVLNSRSLAHALGASSRFSRSAVRNHSVRVA